jgi:hypothetical protein
MKKKILLRILGAAVAVLIGVYVVADVFLGSIVKAGVNRFGPGLTHTKVELAGAHISPLTGSGTLTGLYVGNPPGWGSGPAFFLGRIHVQVNPKSLFGNHVVIDTLTIEKPEFTYETKIFSSNIGDLLKAIGGSSETGQPKATAANGRQIRFIVKHFRVTGGLVRVGVGPAALPLPMPPIALDNIGTAEGGITGEQLAFAVMRSLAGGVVEATTQAAGKVGSTLGAAAGNAIQNAGSGLEGLFHSKSK